MASRAGYVAQGSGSQRRYTLTRDAVLRMGRRREYLRLFAVTVTLFVLQLPMRSVALGDTTSVDQQLDRVQALHLSIAIDFLFIVSYLYLGRRSLEIARAHRAPQPVVQAAVVGLVLLVVGALMDVWENVRLWKVFLGDDPSLTLSWHQALALPTGVPLADAAGLYSWAMRVLVAVGIIMLLASTAYRTDRIPEPLESDHTPDEHGTVICCSGGGIRATAFSLGGLQVLERVGIYQKASAVVGVSGGGYIASAAHVLRWRPSSSERNTAGEWPHMDDGDAPFALGTPELAWVRRHTRYVLNSLRVAAEAVLSLLFGIAVNLILVAAALFGTAVVLAWLFLASGRLQPWPQIASFSTTERDRVIDGGMGGAYIGGWHFLSYSWVVPLAGILLFVATKFVDRYWSMRLERRRLLGEIVTMTVGVGIVLVLLFQVAPTAVAGISHYAATSDSDLAGLLYQLGFVPAQACIAIVTSRPGCGANAGSVSSPSLTFAGAASLVTVVGSIFAVLASAKSAATDKQGSGLLGGFRKKLWNKIKSPIVPWTALAIILVVLVFVFLVLLLRKVQNFDAVSIFRVAWVIGTLLVLAKLVTEPNRTSMHSFFRERISDAFLVLRGRDRIDPVDYHRPLCYSASAPKDGGPRLVSCAVANVTDEDFVPSRRGCTPFVFDHDRIGLTDRLLPSSASLRTSSVYEFAADDRYRVATIPAATAISAAAFSPLAGRENVHLGPYRAVMALGNARLGVWLPNPVWIDDAYLGKRLLTKGRVVEAAHVWSTLSLKEQQYLQLSPSAMKRLATGFLIGELNEALDDLESALGTTSASDEAQPALLDAARERVYAALLDAHQLEPSVTVPVPDGDLWSALRNAIRQVAPKPVWYSYLTGPGREIIGKPGLSRLLKEAVGKASVYDRFLYVTDGGHYDNLGLVEALRRRPEHIILLDASNDPEDTFRALGRAIATARMDLDCEVTLDPRHMKTAKGERAAAAWCVGSYTYANEPKTSGRILLAKAIMLDDLTWDIATYAGESPDFPRTSTTNQLYSEFDFEAYRALGSEAVTRLLESEEYLENPIVGSPRKPPGKLQKWADDATAWWESL